MQSCMPILMLSIHQTVNTIGHNALKTKRKLFTSWHNIDWQTAHLIVKSLQARIVKAVKAGKWKRVRDLQRLIAHSTSAKVLAIRRVCENTGKRTVGIDGQKWDNAKKKYDAIEILTNKGYKAKAVRRIKIPKQNGKMRPLGIPTMKDRAMQALHLLGLDPVSETLADSTSYGFRRARSSADAISKLHKLLVRKFSPIWILEGDIKGCFDHISHDWLLQHIPMNKRILKQWLKSGYIENRQLFSTSTGTPQGSVISPTLANMVLDGLLMAIDEALNIKRIYRDGRNKNPHKIHFIRYADDFVVLAESKEILKEKVQPVIEQFLKERGLELSKEKTKLTRIDDGFDFLGKNIRKFNGLKGKLIIQPSKKNIRHFIQKIQTTIHRNRTAKTYELIYLLNSQIRGWALYHRTDNAKQAFSYVDNIIWKMVWRWARRRHRNKSKKWITKKYYRTFQGRSWTLFDYDEKGKLVKLIYASKIPIKYHIHIRADVNPYDPADELYYERRYDRQMLDKLTTRKRLTLLYKKQKGKCLACQQKITKQTGWDTHHLTPKYLGGKSNLDNLVLLHPICHQQLHSKDNCIKNAELLVTTAAFE